MRGVRYLVTNNVGLFSPRMVLKQVRRVSWCSTAPHSEGQGWLNKLSQLKVIKMTINMVKVTRTFFQMETKENKFYFDFDNLRLCTMTYTF